MKKENIIKNYPKPITIEQTDIILQQMKNCICKIYINRGKIGTGFFCHIPYKNEILQVLITNYHIINDDYIKQNRKYI